MKILLALCLAFLGFQPIRAAVASSEDVELNVYVDFLTSQLGLPKNGILYNFQDTIQSSDTSDLIKDREVPKSLLVDFNHKNNKTKPLLNELVKKFPIRLWTKEDGSHYFPPDSDLNKDWDSYYKAFPGSGGIYSLSRVGFSSDGQYAMIEMGQSYASLGGSGRIYVLKRNPKTGHWDMTKQGFDTWIS